MIFSGRFILHYGLSVVRQANRLRFSHLVALGEASPLLGLRAVRNADDFGLSYLQIGHIALTAQKMSSKLTLTNTYTVHPVQCTACLLAFSSPGGSC